LIRIVKLNHDLSERDFLSLLMREIERCYLNIIYKEVGIITMDEINKEQYIRELFIELLLMLRAGALQNLGMLTNPATGKKETKVDLAKRVIDMLGMLQKKTEGNLSDQETKMLENLLAELRILYIKESKSNESDKE